MLKPSKSAQKLADMIKHAIDDGEITSAEYEKILALADADHHHDPQETRLLKELQEMLSNGTVKRVK